MQESIGHNTQRHTKEAKSRAPRAVIPAKAGIQHFRGVLDCPIKSDNDKKRGFTNGLISKSQRVIASGAKQPHRRLPRRRLLAMTVYLLSRYVYCHSGLSGIFLI